MSVHNVCFAIPGDLNTLTGGYGYDRRLLAGLQQLGIAIRHHALPAGFPAPGPAAMAATAAWLQQLPDGSSVLVDGLAFGVMDTLAEQHGHRLRLLALCHHPLALETGLDSATRARLQQSEQRALAAASAVIVTSARTGQLLQQHFAVPAGKITVALPGTDRRALAACAGDPPVLLTVATLTRRKAHDVLIAALAQVQDLPWQARLVGGADFDPAWAARLQQQVLTLGLQHRITFVGELADLHPHYLAADLFVLPSRFEGYGMAFAEALAYGLPIIAAHAGAVPDVVPQSAGVLVEPDDVEALSAALRAVLSDSSRRQQLQRGASAAALHLPSWQQTAAIVRDLLQQVGTT